MNVIGKGGEGQGNLYNSLKVQKINKKLRILSKSISELRSCHFLARSLKCNSGLEDDIPKLPSLLNISSSRIHRSLTGGIKSTPAWVDVPARQQCSLACRYDNPMPELTLSPSQGSMNSATGSPQNTWP
jgi:hypothetical protein